MTRYPPGSDVYDAAIRRAARRAGAEHVLRSHDEVAAMRAHADDMDRRIMDAIDGTITMDKCASCGTYFQADPPATRKPGPQTCPACAEAQSTKTKIHRAGAWWVS